MFKPVHCKFWSSELDKYNNMQNSQFYTWLNSLGILGLRVFLENCGWREKINRGPLFWVRLGPKIRQLLFYFEDIKKCGVILQCMFRRFGHSWHGKKMFLAVWFRGQANFQYYPSCLKISRLLYKWSKVTLSTQLASLAWTRDESYSVIS